MIKQQQKLQNGGSSRISTTNSSHDANHSSLRPYDTLGPPSDPIEFPRPQLVRGRRDTVVCYNPVTDEHEVLENVLFRDCLVGRNHPSASPSTRRTKGAATNTNTTNHCLNSRNTDKTAGTNNDTTTKAFWPIPYKAKIQTIMGHVEYVDLYLLKLTCKEKIILTHSVIAFFKYHMNFRMCRVLKRCVRQRDADDDDFDNDDSSNDEGYYDDDDDEIVFEWTDQRVAVKVNYTDRMDRLRDRHAENPLQEIAAMQLLGNDPIHVLGAMDVLFDGQNLNVVMRYCDSGDLFQLLQDRQNQLVDANATTTTILSSNATTPPGLPEGEVRYWFRQVMDGVKYLHECGICHRDLSPENIMIDGDEGVIIDMGMCLRVPYIDPTNTEARTDITQTHRTRTTATRCLIRPQGACGKLPYMCPEILASRQPFDGEAADVWTSGTILFCMITGNRSYQRPHMTDPQFYWMTQGLRQLLSDWNVCISEEGIELLQGMLEIDPRKRLTLDEVCHHPWFRYPDEPPTKMETASNMET